LMSFGYNPLRRLEIEEPISNGGCSAGTVDGEERGGTASRF
jgi:hypothetical protein